MKKAQYLPRYRMLQCGINHLAHSMHAEHLGQNMQNFTTCAKGNFPSDAVIGTQTSCEPWQAGWSCAR